MNTYKEIFIDFESNSELKWEEINFTKASEFKVRHSVDIVQSKPRGFNFSLPNYLIFGNIEHNSMTLTITKTIQTRDNPRSTATPFIKKYRLIFTDLIIENVTANAISDEAFSLTIFTLDGSINQVEFNSAGYTTSSGSFNTSMDIITVEYLNFFNSNFFALGSNTGIIYLIKLENLKGNLKLDVVEEIKKSNFKDKLSSLMNMNLNLNIFSGGKKTSYDSIKSIKHVGNNLIAYVTEQFNFKIYNYKTKREIYTNCLIKNRVDERVINSKINFYVLNFTEEDLRQSRSKCFIFTVYLEYNFTFVLNSFEVWFANIPEIDLSSFSQSDNIGIIKDFNAFYEFIDLGQDIRIKNIRVYNLTGKLVNILNYEKKIWVLSENPHHNEAGTNDASQNEILKYNLKIFSINKLFNPLSVNEDFENSHPLISEEPKIVFYDYQIKNLENILNQIKAYKNYNVSFSDSDNGAMPRSNKKMTECLSMGISNHTEVQLLFQLLSSDFIEEEILISYFNLKFVNPNSATTQKFLNKSQVLSFIEKTCLSASDHNAIRKSKTKDSNFSSFSFMQTIIEDLIRKSHENVTTSIGYFMTKEIEGLALIRKKGISFFKTGGEFECVNESINSHEYYLRNLIFGTENVNKYQSHNIIILNELQSKIMNYLTLESKQSNQNILFIIMALLRIYLTEVYLLINDEKYLTNYFVNFSTYSEYNINILDAFVKEHFEANMENQFSNLNYLDIIHQVIHYTYLNNKSSVDEHIKDILIDVDEYKKSLEDTLIEAVEAENYRGEKIAAANTIKTEKYNSKFIEILTKLTFAKVQAFYNISRDLLGFVSWVKKFFKNSNPTIYTESYNNRQSNMSFNLMSLKEKIQNNFYETSSSLILANHRCKVNLKESSIIENICFVEKNDFTNKTPYSNSLNNIEVNYVQLTIYNNLYIFGPNIFRDMQNNYIDYIITGIWTGSSSIQDEERVERKLNFNLAEKKKYNMIEKLFKMKEYKLISLLIKLQDDSDLEGLFLDIICQGYLEDMQRMKDYLNKYFTLLIDVSNEAESTGFKVFNKFEEFYSTFSRNLIKKDFSAADVNTNIKTINNYVIAGFYYIEEQMKFILTDEMKYEFYFHCYSFIYPTISRLEYTFDSEEANRIRDFLVNMLKSCVDIDIDLAISCYNTIIKNLKTLNSNDEVIGIFVDYLAKSPENISFCRKLLTQDYEFIDAICQNLEKRCEKLKDNTKILFLLKWSLKLETESVVVQIAAGEKQNTNSSLSINSQYIVDLERNVNYFYILSLIYSLFKDHEKAAKTYHSYSESIRHVINMNDFNVRDLKTVYDELKSVLRKVVGCLDQMSVNMNQSNINFLYKEINAGDNSVVFITKDDIEKDLVLIDAKIELLNFFIKNENKLLNSGLTMEEYNKIRNTNTLLNYLFRYMLYEVIIEHEVVYALDNASAQNLIKNMIKVLVSKLNRSARNKLNDVMEVDQEENLALSNFNREDANKYHDYYMILLRFYEQIVTMKKGELVITAIECVLYSTVHLNAKLPDILIECAKRTAPIKFCEVLIKYSRLQDFVDLVFYMAQENVTIPKYLIENAYSNLRIESYRNIEILELILRH